MPIFILILFKVFNKIITLYNLILKTYLNQLQIIIKVNISNGVNIIVSNNNFI